MLKQLGQLEIRKSSDYFDRVAKALQEAGFILVLQTETSTEKYYIVAEDDKKQ